MRRLRENVLSVGIILQFTMGSTPPRKKSKAASKYLEKWEADSRFSGWLTKSKNGSSHAYCRLCNRDFRVDHGGLNDVTKHSNTAMHMSNCKAQNSMPAASNFFASFKLDQDEGKTIFYDILCKYCNFILIFYAFHMN
jgi:hypothetical protein